MSETMASSAAAAEEDFPRMLKAEQLTLNAPRMLVFCLAYVLIQLTTLLLSSSQLVFSFGDLTFLFWLSGASYLPLKSLAILVGSVFSVLFFLAVRGSIKSPKTLGSLLPACLILLTLLQLMLGFFELATGFYLFFGASFLVLLGAFPVLSRVQSTILLSLFAFLFLLLPAVAYQPQSGIGGGVLSSSSGLFGPAPEIIYLSPLGGSHTVFIIMAFLVMGICASWLNLSMVKRSVKLLSEAEKREQNLLSHAEQRISGYQEQAHAAEVANVAKTRFLTRVSHEMRTAMNTISGMLFIAREASDETTRQESLEAVELASQKLKDIVGNIIDTTRIELDFSGEDFNQDFALLSADAAEPQQLLEQVQAPDLTGHTILIAEDVETNRFVLREFLRDTNASIEEAPNGKIAVEMFAASPEQYYSFIFMDLLMPEMNGHEATRAIRKMIRSDAASVPIVAVSANAFTEDIEASLAAGMDAHLAKPVEQAGIFRVLNERLS